jgi:hypothetical protein
LRENYLSTGAFFRSAWPAAINQWSNEPPEWGQGMEGYGKRLASQFAARSLQGSIEHGVAAAIRTDPRYERCQCAGFLPRLGHAVASNFVTRTSSGGRTVNVPFMAGTYGSAMASLAWYPERYSWKDGFREGSQRLLISGSFNVFREFWPEMKRVLPFVK